MWNPDEYMRPQEASWTCAACSLAWVLRSTGLDPVASEWSMVEAIGRPHNINPTYGLMDGSGAALQDVLAGRYGQASDQQWLNFDAVYELAQQTTGMMSGGAWYHWVALRGVQGNYLWLANSGPGYKGVYDILGRSDFERLGPFSVVWLV